MGETDSYGDLLTIRFEWCFGPSPLATSLTCASAMFHPHHDGKLGMGKWWAFPKESVYAQLFKELKTVFADNPARCLSPSGYQRCLDAFDWQPKHHFPRQN